MALSNIFREPGREITETAVGLAVVGIPFSIPTVLAAVARPAGWTYWEMFRVSCVVPVVVVLGLSVIVFFFVMFARCVHDLGEVICDVLQRGFRAGCDHYTEDAKE